AGRLLCVARAWRDSSEVSASTTRTSTSFSNPLTSSSAIRRGCSVPNTGALANGECARPPARPGRGFWTEASARLIPPRARTGTWAGGSQPFGRQDGLYNPRATHLPAESSPARCRSPMSTEAATLPRKTPLLQSRLGSFLAVFPLTLWVINHLWNNLAAFYG